MRDVRVLSESIKDLARLERYERRAVSRRKFAIRRFDEDQQRLGARDQKPSVSQRIQEPAG
jgi:hypothetical protein